jgi:hypothetical protein
MENKTHTPAAFRKLLLAAITFCKNYSAFSSFKNEIKNELVSLSTIVALIVSKTKLNITLDNFCGICINHTRIPMVNKNTAKFAYSDFGNWVPFDSIKKKDIIRINIKPSPNIMSKGNPYSYQNVEVVIIGKDKHGLIGLFNDGRLKIVTNIFQLQCSLGKGNVCYIEMVSTLDKTSEAYDHSWQDVKKMIGRNPERVERTYH